MRKMLMLCAVLSTLTVTNALAQSIQLVKDAGAGSLNGVDTNSTNAAPLVLGNGKMVYLGHAGTDDYEPWVTDGTASGTKLLQDVFTGSSGSGVKRFESDGAGGAYFLAYGAGSAVQLWYTDGVTATKKGDLPGTLSTVYFESLRIMGGSVYFFARDNSGTELWKWFGGNTFSKVVDLNAGSPDGVVSTQAPVTLGSKLFFVGQTALNGTEVFATQGDQATTAVLKDIIGSSGSSNPENLTVCNGNLYFTAADLNGRQVWEYVPGGATALVAGQPSVGRWNKLTCSNNRLFASASEIGGASDTVLYAYATGSWTQILDVQYGGTISSHPSFCGGKYYFSAGFSPIGNEVLVTSGAATAGYIDVNAGSMGSQPMANPSRPTFECVNYAGSTYFSAYTSTFGYELYKTDGTTAGTYRLSDLNLGSGDGIKMNRSVVVGGKFLFAGMDQTSGLEWRALNFAPESLKVTKDSIREDAAVGAEIAQVSALSKDGDVLGYALDARYTDLNVFELVGTSLRLKRPLDFEADQVQWTIGVRAFDATDTISQTFILRLVDVNEAPTGIIAEVSSISENIQVPTSYPLAAVDPDAGDTHTFALLPGMDSAYFSISGSDLVLNKSPDFALGSSLNVKLRVTDAKGLSFDQLLTLTVLDMVEPPSGLVLKTMDLLLTIEGFPENLPVGTRIGRLVALDDDVSDMHSFFASGSMTDFSLIGDTLVANTSFDFETVQNTSADITVYDNSAMMKAITLPLKVQNVNEQPFVDLPDTLPKAFVGIQYASPIIIGDPDNTVPQVLKSGPIWLGVDAQAKSFVGMPLVADTGTYTVVITAKDGQFQVSDTAVVIVRPQSEYVSPIFLSTNTVPENQAPPYLVGVIRTSTGKPIAGTVALKGGDLAAFEIQNDSLLYARATFDYEKQRKYSLQLAVPIEQNAIIGSLNINVVDVNEAPVWTNPDTLPMGVAGSAYNFKPGLMDPDSGASLSVKVLEPSWLSADTMSKSLIGIPPQKGLVRIVVMANDGTFAPMDTLWLPVSANTAPNFLLNKSVVNSVEDAGVVRIPALVSQLNPGVNASEMGQQLHFEIFSLDTLKLALAGNDTAAFFRQKPWIDMSTGDLVFEAQPDIYGWFQMGIRLRDNGGTVGGGVDSSAVQRFAIAFEGVNDAPAITKAMDTIRSFPGQPEVLKGWAQSMSVGNQPEKLSGQKIVSAQLRFASADSSKFITLPVIDLATGDLSLNVLKDFRGQISAQLVVRDDGGTALNGVDSAVFPITLVAGTNPNRPRANPPVLSWAKDGLPIVQLTPAMEWAVDTLSGSLNKGDGSLRILKPQDEYFVRMAENPVNLASAWVRLRADSGVRYRPGVAVSGTALGLWVSDDDRAQISNAQVVVELADLSLSKVVESSKSSRASWSKGFLNNGKYGLKVRIETSAGQAAQLDTVLEVKSDVGTKRIAVDPNMSSWILTGLGGWNGDGLAEMTAYWWKPGATMDAKLARYQALGVADLNPARGAWVLAEKDFALNLLSKPVQDSVSIELSAEGDGWNLVANPYPFPIGGDAVPNSDSIECWQWDRAKSDYVKLSDKPLEAFGACWIWTAQTRPLKFYPRPEIRPENQNVVARMKPVAMSADQSVLRLKLNAGQYQDVENEFGFGAGIAQAEVPSPVSGRISASFVGKGTLLRKDVRVDTMENTWNVSLSSGVSGVSSGVLSIDGVDALAQSGKSVFYRLGGGEWMAYRSGEQVAVSLGSKPSAAQIRIVGEGLVPQDAHSLTIALGGQLVQMAFVEGQVPAALHLVGVDGALRAILPLRQVQGYYEAQGDIPNGLLYGQLISERHKGSAKLLVQP